MQAREGDAVLSERYAELLEKNRRFLWNPFTQMKGYLESEPLIVERADGVRLVDVDGRSYYDGNSSMWLNVHGHRKAELDRAIAGPARAGRPTRPCSGQASVPALELAERLVGIVAGRAREGLLLGLGLGGGRDRAEDGGRLLAAARSVREAHASQHAQRLPRRHRRSRLGRRHRALPRGVRAAALPDPQGLLPVRRTASTARRRSAPPPALPSSRPTSRPTPARRRRSSSSRSSRAAAGMIAMPPGFLRGAAELCRAPRRAARRRRGGDGLRSHRPHVRLRARGRRARPA